MSLFADAPMLTLPVLIPAQMTTGKLIVNGVIVAALAGAVLFAVCRSSSRN